MPDLTATIKAVITHNHQNAQDLSTPTDSLSLTKTTNFTYGTAANQAQTVWSDVRTLAAGASERIDLYDLAIDGGAAQRDQIGLTVTMACIKGLLVYMANTTAAVGDQLTVGGYVAATTQAFWSPFSLGSSSTQAGVVLGPGGGFMVWNPSAAGYTVTDGANHLLKIANTGSTTVQYGIWFMGENV